VNIRGRTGGRRHVSRWRLALGGERGVSSAMKRRPAMVLHTATEVAKRLGLHPQTVYRHARDGQLPMRQIGNRWYMTDADLKHILRGDRGGGS
jgi:excisionase family DNA binding protein